jgi:hypothetical protein
MDSNNRLITGGIEDKKRHAKVMEKWEQIKKVGYEIVTLVNCMPFPLEQHGMAGNFHVRACDIKTGEMFVAFTFDRPRMPVTDEGEAKFIPETVLPIEIGMEFARVYEEYGGVFFYRRNRDGSDIPKAELMQLVAEARERMTVWMVAQYNLGEDSWQKFNKRSDKIPPQSRDAAHFLKQEGVIDQLPEWVHTKRSTSGTKPCKWCAETIKENAIVCRFCTMRQDMDISQQSVGKARSEENDHAAPVGSIPPLQPSTPLVSEGSDGDDDGIGEDLADLDNPNAKAENKTVTKALPKPNGKKN